MAVTRIVTVECLLGLFSAPVVCFYAFVDIGICSGPAGLLAARSHFLEVDGLINQCDK